MKYGLNRVNNVFDELFRDTWNGFEDWGKKPFVRTGYQPKMNINETEDSYIIDMIVPGIASDDIDLRVENNILYISYQATSETEIKDDTRNYLSKEFEISSFTRSIRLGNIADTDNISAKLSDGMLKISIPKKDPPKKINIVIK